MKIAVFYIIQKTTEVKDMEIKILTDKEKEMVFDQILDMLVAADNDFIPPLSSRTSTTQSNLTGGEKCPDGVKNYFEEMKPQMLLTVSENGKVLGFMSYKENYVNGPIKEEDTPNIYLSTMIVRSECRGRGISTAIYGHLTEKYSDRNIFTRTWATNASHTKTLSRYGFETLCVLPNDRGEGIDTVYFVKRAGGDK